MTQEEYNAQTDGIVKLATRIVQENPDAVAKLKGLQADQDTKGLIEFLKDLKGFIDDRIKELNAMDGKVRMRCRDCKHFLLCDTGFPYNNPDKFYFCNHLYCQYGADYNHAERKKLCGNKFFEKRKPTDPKSIDELVERNNR